jgi:hypothetical protein
LLVRLLSIIGTYLDIAAPLAALSFALFKREVWVREYFYIVLFLMVEVLLNGWGKFLMVYDPKGSNIIVYKINCITSFVILSLFFAAKWKPSIKKKQLFILRVTTLLVSALLLIILRQEEDTGFNSTSYSLASLVLCTYCIIYYTSKLEKPDTEKITTLRSFWFITGIFTYYAGCFFIFVSYKLLTINETMGAPSVWLVHNMVFALMCTLFIIGFRCKQS